MRKEEIQAPSGYRAEREGREVLTAAVPGRAEGSLGGKKEMHTGLTEITSELGDQVAKMKNSDMVAAGLGLHNCVVRYRRE